MVQFSSRSYLKRLNPRHFPSFILLSSSQPRYQKIATMPAGSSDDMWVGAKHDPSLTLPPDMKHELGDHAHDTELPAVYEGQATMQSQYMGDDFPSLEEIKTLRRVSAKIPWKVYTIAFVELCERFSYYGTQILCMFLLSWSDQTRLTPPKSRTSSRETS